ncbi:MAG: hypothetical protein R3244_10350 [Thermoanaerobaculia bacterium]|nr:hypothetical protein [Thermoanaerobaculia bacterium]
MHAPPTSRLPAAIALGIALALGACASPPLSPAPPTELEISSAARQRAAELLALAGSIEPRLTTRLVALTDELEVDLWSLEHRLKSRASLERKLQTAALESGVGVERVVVDDALRYTVLIEDEPAGRYDRIAAEILRRLEGDGYPVLEVKNYWPPGDIYSGVNCVLAAAEGLRWELQFHTIGSVAAKSEGHDLYEEFRLPQTRLDRKRRIYDRLLDRWSWVEIPAGVLEPGSLHTREEIILRGRP